MTEPTTPSERQVPPSPESRKNAQLPLLSKSLKTPSPGFVSKIPIPARLVKERSPKTSPTAIIGSKASPTEQNEHWRQYRPPSNPTTPVSTGEGISVDDTHISDGDKVVKDNSNYVTPVKDMREDSLAKSDHKSEHHLEEPVADLSKAEDTVSPVDESLQSNVEDSSLKDKADSDIKGNHKVHFDENSPEKIVSYWDSLQTAAPNSKMPDNTPYYKSPLANTVNFDESTTENEDSAFMGELSYGSDIDDIRTYRPSFLDETSFMSEMDATNASTTTLDKEAVVQRFFAGASESEFTIYEDSRYADFPESFAKTDDHSTLLVNPESSVTLQHSITEIDAHPNKSADVEAKAHDSSESDKTDITGTSETIETHVENSNTEDVVHQSGGAELEASESDIENNVKLYSEVVQDMSENTAPTDAPVGALETEQTVPVQAESPEDSEQTVPEQEANTDSLTRPNISYADIVSYSSQHTSEQDEQDDNKTMESEPSNMEESLDNSWPLKFPLPSTPFGQEASTQIENLSQTDADYHSEITWNYNEELGTDNNDEKLLHQDASIDEVTLGIDSKEEIDNSTSYDPHSTEEGDQEDAVNTISYGAHSTEENAQEVYSSISDYIHSNGDNDLDYDKKEPSDAEIDNSDLPSSNSYSRDSETRSFSNVETPHKILKQLSSRQVSSAPPPAKLDEYYSYESELPKSAKTVRELTPMRLLQSLSRMTTPSETIKNLNDRFKDSDISMSELDDTFIRPALESELVSDESIHNSISTDDKEISDNENKSKVDFEQSRFYSDQDESSLLDQYDSQFERSELEEYSPNQTFEESQLEEPSLNADDFLYEDMVQAINNLKEIMGELKDGQDIHRNLGDALEANLNELNDKTHKRDGLLLEMTTMKEIVDQTNNEMGELKSQLDKRVRSEEEVDAKLADVTEVVDTLKLRIKNKAEQLNHSRDTRTFGSLSSFIFNALILLGVFVVLELLFVRVMLRNYEQPAFGTMSHGTLYPRDQVDQPWSVHFARNIWELLVSVFHGSASGMSVPS
ncbi:hypothetical protein K7432_014844 [Basidiobolus ranarum]|uniref:Uncharacterized protein n=1 Tax=Basidiobolus ranarum TaxID=34480 RepID=A0ABR2VNX1_9FUNG